MSSAVIVRSVDGTKFTQDVEAGAHALVADEPSEYGGEDRGPGPYDFLLTALGTCTAMTLRMYAERKGWPLDSVAVRLTHGRIHAKDCEGCETEEGLVDEIRSEVTLEGALDDRQRQRLMEIAERCPVHRTLSSETKIRMV